MFCRECGQPADIGEMCQACADLANDELVESDESLDEIP